LGLINGHKRNIIPNSVDIQGSAHFVLKKFTKDLDGSLKFRYLCVPFRRKCSSTYLWNVLMI